LFTFTPKENPTLNAIETIYERTRQSSFKEKSMQACASEIATVADFFGCSHEEAVMLSIMIQCQLENESISTKGILEHAGLKKSNALSINQVLQPLVQKEWISPKRDLQMNPLTEYTIQAKLIRSVWKGKLDRQPEPKMEHSSQIIIQFKSKLQERIDKRITYKGFLKSAHELVQKNSSVELCAFISQLQLSTEDTAYFLYVCCQFYYGNESVELDTIITELMPPIEEQYKLRNAYRTGTHYLLTGGYIKESVSMDLFGGKSYAITEKAVHAFDKTAIVNTTNLDGICKHVDPTAIAEKKLIFEGNEQILVNKLHTILRNDQFVSLTDRLEDLGMKKGISILLYGEPGTGKTETVLQLGKTSNRYIMMADASKIRSKWVGETEKNMKALFDEYRKSLKEYDDVPILMFNEADSILGKRLTVSDRGDQMENAMQNILLQELENFEGIFIATTNLVTNLDKAFDRRFLYKIRFEKPSTQTLMKIWKSKIPSIKSSILKKICSSYSLSGGQIENIRKKIAVDSLLNSKLKLSESYVVQLIQQELMLETKKERNPIGFLR
jgi:DNA-binding Xre family transcriptional regulator